ncbi:hypothetical protein VHUM_02534 [Vanrija humicola]|uniref:DAGKc domain-containing protein n=1 Tax=Vanrija humicola TaxID=5417 RepID=A0A7D8YZV0_VANHU|nr:hypothetical protein VHUM_02534 [Vanrija humicola]
MPDADAPPKYHVIVNPIAGTGSAPKFINDHVCSLLERLGIQADVHVTESVKDAGRIGRDIVLERIDAPPQDGVTRVVVGGGDGTAHEFIEGVLAAVEEKGVPLGKWALVTLPLGTANALHSTHFPPDAAPLPIPASIAPAVGDISPEVHQALSSLFLALDGAPARPLPITLTSLVRADGSVSEVVPDHIVLSTALHAAILSDSDALRAEHPGLERYKLAAAANIAEFFPADVELVPDSERGVRQYDPRTRAEAGGRVRLNGPFTYFLTTNSTARLEPTFVIAPTLASLPRDEGERTTDIVILRPLRDPAVRKAIDDGGDGGAQWVARAKEVLGGAYQDGRHVQFTYAGPGPVEDAGPGDVVVETFRAAGFTWRPTDDTHAKSHIVCADGSLYDIEVGGEARAHVLGSEAADGASADRGFWVWG